jgi:hypothetical protein
MIIISSAVREAGMGVSMKYSFYSIPALSRLHALQVKGNGVNIQQNHD